MTCASYADQSTVALNFIDVVVQIGCTKFKVTGGDFGVAGMYTQAAGPPGKDGTHRFEKDETHDLYHLGDIWCLGETSVKRFYTAPPDEPERGLGVPHLWDDACPRRAPTVSCVSSSAPLIKTDGAGRW